MTKKILSILKNSDGYVSGEKISAELGITRAAVWKHIEKLRQHDCNIESVTKKGYRLVSSPDIISEADIRKTLRTKYIGKEIRTYDEADSTNERAKENSDLPDGSVFIAEEQTKGKGSRGRSWVSEKGTGIWLSILLKPDISPIEVSGITLAAGLAVCSAIGLNSRIKWPNDIVIGSKKVCGILTEMSSESNVINYIVCGIGINVSTERFDESIEDRATSIYIESSKRYDRAYLTAKLLNSFEGYYEKFLNNGLVSLIDEYKENCITLGREVNVIYKGRSFRGKAEDVDENGSLVVTTDEGIMHITSGEVSVRGIYGYV